MKKKSLKAVIKCVHLLFSLILLSTSIFLFVCTFLMEPKFSVYSTYLNVYSSKPVFFLYVGSTLAVVVAILGIITVIREWIRGIITFALFIFYLFIAMLALAITAFFLSSSVNETMHSSLKTDMSNYSLNKKIVDDLQIKLLCCGVNDFTDWAELLGYIPGSCCQSAAFCDPSEVLKLHLSGCYTALKDIVEYSMTMVFFVLVGLGIVQACLIINSILLVCCLRREKNGRNYEGSGDSIQLPRIHNPLGQNTTPNIMVTRSREGGDGPWEPVYVRRPIQRPIILAYKSPHEDYLHRAPQYRFDHRRINSINNKLGKHTPYVYDSSRYF